MEQQEKPRKLNPFLKWAVEEYGVSEEPGEVAFADDPEGDFVHDAYYDSTFPSEADYHKIRSYLRYKRHACREALDAFKELWSEYIKASPELSKGVNDILHKMVYGHLIKILNGDLDPAESEYDRKRIEDALVIIDQELGFTTEACMDELDSSHVYVKEFKPNWKSELSDELFETFKWGLKQYFEEEDWGEEYYD